MSRIYSLDFFRKIAAENGGECLSIDYHGLHSYIKFRCKIGHEWQAKAKKIIYENRWCPSCGLAIYDRHDINTFQLIAKKRMGECLSLEYTNSITPLLFRCEYGHDFQSRPANILHRNSWCPVCAKAKEAPFKKDPKASRLKQMQNIAIARLGKCLSTQYLGDKVHLEFECADGHRWKATPNTIKRPHWCPFCKNGTRQINHAQHLKVKIAM